MRIIRMIPGDDFRTVSEFSALLGSSMEDGHALMRQFTEFWKI